MHNQHNRHKNAIKLDIIISKSLVAWLLYFGVFLFVGLICVAVGLAWWQWLILLLVAVLCSFSFYHAQKQRVYQISTKQIDGIWFLAVPKKSKAGNQSAVHQAYLQRIYTADFALIRAIILEFYVIIPKKQPVRVVLFSDQITQAAFRQLSALSKLYTA